MAKSMKELCAYARKKAKQKHKYGRKSPMSWNTHFDCHWFTEHIYKECGYTDVAKAINKGGFYKHAFDKKYMGKWLHKKKMGGGFKQSELKPGDILLSWEKKVHHSAIYLGDGKIAEMVKRGSRVTKLRKYFKICYRVPDRGGQPEPKPEPKPTPKPEPKKKTKTVEHKATYKVLPKIGVNVRKSYSTKSARVGGVGCGKTVACTKKHGNWIYVPKQKGWMCIKSGKTTLMKKV